MTTETAFDPAKASGETNYNAPRPLELNEVMLNGDGDVTEVSPGKFERKGGFFRKRILIGNPKGEKPEEVNLGTEASVIFLKIRRRLMQRGTDGKIIRSTNEHNTPNESVFLYEEGSKEPKIGVATDLRKEHEGLRTVQVVYALLLGEAEPELVKVVLKGASLGSEVKAEGVTKFYEYLSSFGKGEHFYEYVTLLKPVLETGKKSYFAINFVRGEKLDEATYALAMQHMQAVHEKCVEIDTARAVKIAQNISIDIVPEPVENVVETGVEYPKDDINPDDIPF
jgi:hypothetical protein